MPFFQDPPRLGNTYDTDALLREVLARAFAPAELAELEPELSELGALAGGPLLERQLAERHLEPRHVPFDPWGRRVDRIELTPLWTEAAALAARHGLVATAYERRHGARSRVHQLALAHVLDPSTDVYSCPLAMSDGAARALLDAGNGPLVDRALPRLTSRDPARAWTSGQWMTERTGGSDVSGTETLARRDGDGWRLWGTKWFSSATTSEMALALARPEGNPAGSRGLALFYVETRAPDGSANGIVVNRLKEKLGTRKLPTAELSLEGARAVPVAGLAGGVRAVAPMLTVTRVWNSVAAAAGMHRALSLARDYARRRVASGTPIAARPLHAETLASLEAEREGALLLALHAGALLGRVEAGEGGDAARLLLRVVTPIAKLTTARQAVAVASEALEAFGGAGYVEDTGLPRLLRDAQVLPIWEGTTNVLALEAVRALGEDGAEEALAAEVRRLAASAAGRPAAVDTAAGAAELALGLLRARDGAYREASARTVALVLGRALEVLLLADHGAWAVGAGRGVRALAAAHRLARSGFELMAVSPPEEAALLADPDVAAGPVAP
jgi:alkylation response protein AidB-like acyl-CoA dehydrogenase